MVAEGVWRVCWSATMQKYLYMDTLVQAWANLLIRRPQWIVKCDRGSGAEADKWSV